MTFEDVLLRGALLLVAIPANILFAFGILTAWRSGERWVAIVGSALAWALVLLLVGVLLPW